MNQQGKSTCIRCAKKPVFSHNNLLLCKEHFISYIEDKVFHTIKKYGLIGSEDKVCIAASGGKDSLNALFLTMKYCIKRKIPFFALAIDEGISSYRNKTLEDLKIFCMTYNIDLHIVSFKNEFNETLDSMHKRAMSEQNKKPCTVCGILRRTLLNRKSRDLGATKLVTGHNLDDESQSFAMNLFLGNMRHNAGLGPITGLQDNDKFVVRIKPLYFISEKESRLYAFLREFKVEFSECPNIGFSFRSRVRDKLNEMEDEFPGIKNGIVNSFLEILPLLKENYKNKKEFSYCKICNDPCAGEFCNACKLTQELGLKKDERNKE